jgi:hypothetical protein
MYRPLYELMNSAEQAGRQSSDINCVLYGFQILMLLS